MTGTVRYDPWGTATSVTGSVPDFRFQGSYADAVTKLSWVVTRWYAAAEGRFLSEDTLLGQPRDPDSRHLYAYGEGEPVGRMDVEGTFWYRVWAGDTLSLVANRYWGKTSKWPTRHTTRTAPHCGIPIGYGRVCACGFEHLGMPGECRSAISAPPLAR